MKSVFTGNIRLVGTVKGTEGRTNVWAVRVGSSLTFIERVATTVNRPTFNYTYREIETSDTESGSVATRK